MMIEDGQGVVRLLSFRDLILAVEPQVFRQHLCHIEVSKVINVWAHCWSCGMQHAFHCYASRVSCISGMINVDIEGKHTLTAAWPGVVVSNQEWRGFVHKYGIAPGHILGEFRASACTPLQSWPIHSSPQILQCASTGALPPH